MTAGARSLTLEETLLAPPALPPPPMRRVLFVILIALAGTFSARVFYNARSTRQHLRRGCFFLRDRRLSAPASPPYLVRRLLDLLGFCLLDQRFARHRLSGHDFSYPVSLLPRSAYAISRPVAMGISCDLHSDRRAMAHLGAMAFPRVFSLSSQLGVAWPSARTYR